jgi:DNA-binding Lrp family transcriptional regulator
MKALILIKMATGETRAALRDLRRLRTVTESHMTFGPFDAIATVDVNDLSHLGRVVAEEIQTIPGVVSTLTCVLVEAEARNSGQAAAEKTAHFN